MFDNELGIPFVRQLLKCQSIQYTNTFQENGNIVHSGFVYYMYFKNSKHSSKKFKKY